MPYKDPARQREYQREWMRKQRALYIEGKSCVDCGSTDDLELDHVDRGQKVDHRIWSWSAKRRSAELAKCVLRCDPCHNERHAAEKRQEHGVGAYKRGCRCQICKDAKAEKERNYRARKQQDTYSPTLFDLEEAA